MRVLLATAWYFPDSVGGTEVYVRGLARHLKRAGVDVAIAAPANPGEPPASYQHDEIPIHRYGVTHSDRGELALTRPEPKEWCAILDRLNPQIVDLHSLTTDLELPHLKAARQRQARTVVTVHVASAICARGTLMKFGTTPCDGDLATQPCTACRMEARGLPSSAAWLMSKVPPRFAADSAHATRQAWLAEIGNETDCVVAVSRWLADTLLRNRIPKHKLVVCRQGVESSEATHGGSCSKSAALRVGFVGRFDPLKGLDVLIDAAHLTPSDVPIEFHIWGSARTAEARAYEADIRTRAGRNPRIVFHGEASRASEAYDAIDVLAVPSICFETGPLVVLEAQAAGLPLVGSNIGGIPERVVHGENGLLVPPGDAAALSEVLAGLARSPAKLHQLRPTGTSRTTADVARETLATYDRILRMAS